MSYKELLGKELNFNYDITFEQACERFPGISRENFDLIRYEYRRDVLGLKPKTKPKTKEKSNNYTKKNVKSEFQDLPNKIEKLTIANTEKLILDMLNKKSSIPESQIRIAVDFMVKLKNAKGDDEDPFYIDSKFLKLVGSEESEEIELDPHESDDMIDVEIDMEYLRKVGIDSTSYPEPNEQEES